MTKGNKTVTNPYLPQEMAPIYLLAPVGLRMTKALGGILVADHYLF
jgi:hypothetical protein